MNKSNIIVFLLLFVLLAGCSKIKNSYPDFCQEDSRFGALPGNGKAYCGPAAISNILIYKNIGSEKDQFQLIKLLGSKEYMNTTRYGTEPINLIQGLKKYLREKGHDVNINWQGWQFGGHYTTSQIPDLNLLKNPNGSILQIGWYKYNSEKDFYERISGHYLTVINYKNDNAVIVHDPSIRSGIESKDEYCKFTKINSGTLSNWHEYNIREANGYYKIEGIKFKEGADTAIVDGIFSFLIK
jgi:hypothetical protein